MSPYEDLRDELILSIQAAALGNPRNHQVAVGPSELGGCARRLAYRAAGTPKLHDDVSWRPTVGTAIHEWLAPRFENILLPDGTSRYLVEQDVHVGQAGTREVHGHVDLYDTVTHTVIDWKCLSPSGMKHARSKKVSHGYQVQRHLYGMGLRQAGYPVAHVAIMALPKSGDWQDMLLLAEPYDEQIALDALERFANIDRLIRAVGVQAPVYTPTTDAEPGLCAYCPWVDRNSTDLTVGCPGVEPAPKSWPPKQVTETSAATLLA